jgi:hypothetical protein
VIDTSAVVAAGSDGFRQRIVRLLSINPARSTLPSFDEDTVARVMRGG